MTIEAQVLSDMFDRGRQVVVSAIASFNHRIIKRVGTYDNLIANMSFSNCNRFDWLNIFIQVKH